MIIYVLIFLGVIVFMSIISGFTGISSLIILFSVILICLLLKRNVEINKTISKVPPNQLHVLNLDKGGIFRLTGVGKNSEEMNLKVVAKHLYRQGDYYWWELECDKGEGEHVWIDIEDDDKAVVSIVLEELKLTEVGVKPYNLTIYDDEESGCINFRGMSFNYEDSDNAIFYRFCDKNKSENLYYWDFSCGQYSLNFEKWGEKEYKAYYCQKMLPSQVTVYLNKEGESK